MKKAGVIGSTILSAVFLCGCNQTEGRSTAVTEQTAAQEQSVWQSDYDAALKQAAAENKYVLVSISGLEWCGWCKALENEVFSQPEFINYAKDNLICVLLDFDRSGRATSAEFSKQHEMLLAKFQIQGFPTVLILNPQGEVVKRTGYQRGGATAYVEMIRGVFSRAK